MQLKSVSPWWPLCLIALAGAAHADTDLGPYSLGASETIEHDSNVTRGSVNGQHQADWLSTTQINAAVDQTLGRGQFVANGLFDINRYKRRHDLNSETYDASTAYNWETVHDLSGSIGADSRRRQYFYGFDGSPPPTGADTTSLHRNLETDNHAFTSVQLGGVSRFTIFAGLDANERRYSDSTFNQLEERQFSAHGGASYATSPDLSFGLTGEAVHGVYPNFHLGADHDGFSSKSVDGTVKWAVSGVSTLDAKLGYTHTDYTAQSGTGYINGSLNWTWKPPSHFSVVFGLSRDSDSDTAAFGALANANNIQGRSINNVAHLDVTYELSAKTSISADGMYTDRRYNNSFVPSFENPNGGTIDGTNHTWLAGLNAHFTPTRTTDVTCGVSREVRTTSFALAGITPGYNDNIVLCTAGIKFD